MASGPWCLRLGHAAGIPRCQRSGAATMGRSALPHGARHGIEDREERERWGRERLTDGLHLVATQRDVNVESRLRG
jgi:hypothetical protein